MKLTHFFTAVLILISFTTETVAAEGKVLTCGKTTVRLFNSTVEESPFFVLKIKAPVAIFHYPYYMDREIFMLRCETSATGKMYVLFNWMCGGTGCNEAGFGLVDADTGKIRLEPRGRWRSDGDEDKASKILGHPIQPFTCKEFSRTSMGAPGAKGELCFVSPQELG
ncbi:hypothetical protein [Methylobacter sp.]|uniref:hypothetical protein n=1 Tax=Methylobacter sp. TaxID=2051955 RepID=UPI002FDDC216